MLFILHICTQYTSSIGTVEHIARALEPMAADIDARWAIWRHHLQSGRIVAAPHTQLARRGPDAHSPVLVIRVIFPPVCPEGTLPRAVRHQHNLLPNPISESVLLYSCATSPPVHKIVNYEKASYNEGVEMKVSGESRSRGIVELTWRKSRVECLQ